nr:hypothetical protein Itr_chr06CG05450 [Ipomoea trifida]GLL43394.1 hypothetical protein Itr_chr12CG31870 [Ipomoea trifida]
MSNWIKVRWNDQPLPRRRHRRRPFLRQPLYSLEDRRLRNRFRNLRIAPIGNLIGWGRSQRTPNTIYALRLAMQWPDRQQNLAADKTSFAAAQTSRMHHSISQYIIGSDNPRTYIN